MIYLPMKFNFLLLIQLGFQWIGPNSFLLFFSLYFSELGPECSRAGLFFLIFVINMGRWICSEINSLWDKRPRCIYHLSLICDSYCTLDNPWDSLNLINTRVDTSIIVLFWFLDSFINCFVKICASDVADDLDGGFSIGQVHQRRLTMRSLSIMPDWRWKRWITVNATTSRHVLVRFSTDEFYSENSIEFTVILSLILIVSMKWCNLM
jgi:hypothetical protein